MVLGTSAGVATGVSVSTELLHLAYSEISQGIRNKTPTLLDYVPSGSVAYGYWPHKNDYTSYSKRLGISGQLVGFFGRHQLDNPVLNAEIIRAQRLGKHVVFSPYFAIHDKDGVGQIVRFARKFKKLFPEPSTIRANPEPNQENNKTMLGIKDGEDFARWHERFYTIMMNEGVNCKFMVCLNTTEEVLNTDQINSYIPSFGVDSIAFDTFKRHRSFPHYKRILPNYSAFRQVAHDVAVLQEILPGVPWGFSEIGSEEDPNFKGDLIRLAPYLGASFVMSFEWNKEDMGDPDEVNWLATRSIREHRDFVDAFSNLAYIPDHVSYFFS